MSVTAMNTARQPLVQAHDLARTFDVSPPWLNRVLEGKPRTLLHAVDGVSYHFSYDSFDQQNFADTANVALLAQMGGKGLPESVAWNAYKNWQNGQGEWCA